MNLLMTIILAVSVPATPSTAAIVGLWESKETSQGGIGHAFEFRSDGTYVEASVVMVAFPYRIEKDRLILEAERPMLEPERVATIRFEGNSVVQTNPDGTILRRERMKPQTAERAPSIAGDWRYCHPAGAIAYDRFTAAGKLMLRLPMGPSTGRYSLEAGVLTLSKAEPGAGPIRVQVRGDDLIITRSASKTSEYRREPTGAWYDLTPSEKCSPGVAAAPPSGTPTPAVAVPPPSSTSRGKAWLSEDLVIYLGCGEVEGPGEVIQLDPTGKKLGAVRLPTTPYGLVVHKDGLLLAALPGGAPGEVSAIDSKGNVETLFRHKRVIPNPIAIAADPSSGDILVADNNTDLVLLLRAGQREVRKVIQLKGYENNFQDMSVAFAQDGHFLFGGSGPHGIYRFGAGEDAALGQPLLRDDGAVAADPSSKRWVAALRNELRIFEENRELARLPYPAGMKSHNAIAFGPDGILVIALYDGRWNSEVVLVDVDAKEFRRLFSWRGSRLVSLAVGRKTPWKK